jgi:uncharacterized protein YlxP (DUF503 family)
VNVGVCKINLHIPGSLSLKDKRRVLKSILAQARNRFNISMAEVGAQDLWQRAELAAACVSNDSRYTNEVLSKVVDFVNSSSFEIEVLDYNIEIIPFS